MNSALSHFNNHGQAYLPVPPEQGTRQQETGVGEAVESTEQPGQQRQFPCKNCGANLQFEPGMAVLKCPYCQTENEVPQAQDAFVEEEDFHATLSDLSRNADTHETLDPVQAKRRVSAGSFRKLARKVASQLPGLKRPGAGRFFYPRRGFGQISEAYAAAAVAAGAELRAGVRVTRLELRERELRPWIITTESAEGTATAEADYVWSTIPVSILPRIMTPAAPEDVDRLEDGEGCRQNVVREPGE